MDNQLVVVKDLKPYDVFVGGGIDSILDEIKKKAKDEANGLSIEKASDRKKIISVAYKVAQSKTAIDGVGKNLVAKQKEEIKKVDAERKKSRDFLDTLKEDIRKPVTEFENKEKARVKDHEDSLSFLNELCNVYLPVSELDIKDLNARIEWLTDIKRDWEEYKHAAETIISNGVLHLTALIDNRKAYDEQQAELERMRKEEEERKQREREEQIKREAAEKAKREAEESAKLEREKIEREKIIAEEKAKQAERDRIAAEERAKIEKEQAVKAAEEKALREAEEKERQRVAAEQARIAKENAERAERERKARDEAHIRKVNTEAIDAFEAEGFGRVIAIQIINFIKSGKIPHVTINY